ncbi:uncharacterized protein LOC110012294 [Sesamum indicum]|uniref:Uncharacterized protein LOC110012294 n=1 Tax=Sesamum indicum TaxID=4182 RepID=A0A8M8V3C9_SESIN|nr:uncharacterized protein LOC110012294 [Sesamum indicum]
MDPPAGLDVSPGLVCKLQRSLYGLKQCQWNLEFTDRLLAFGFRQSTHEHCLFTKCSDSEFTALLDNVDDILLTSFSEAVLHSLKHYLDRLFTIKDLGPTWYFLSLEFARSPHGLQVTQREYLHDILSDSSMLHVVPASTPFPSSLKLTHDGAIEPVSSRPRTSHWDATLHVLRYLKGTTSTGIFFYSSSSVHLTAYSDASWASCLDSSRSITGYCIFLGTSLVYWKTKKQATVHILQLRQNIAAWSPLFYVILHSLNSFLFKLGFISPTHIFGSDQIAYLFTKSLPAADFARFLSKLGLSSSAPS